MHCSARGSRQAPTLLNLDAAILVSLVSSPYLLVVYRCTSSVDSYAQAASLLRSVLCFKSFRCAIRTLQHMK